MLPQMNDNFRAFVAPAAARRGAVRLTVGIVVMVLIYGFLTFALMGVFAVLFVPDFTANPTGALARVQLDVIRFDTARGVLLILVTFTAMLAGVWIAILMAHGRDLPTLLGPGPHGRAVRLTLIVAAPLMAVAILSGFLSYDPVPNVPFTQWLPLMALALPLLLLQVSAEELVFRGYLMQEFAARSSRRAVYLVLPAILFGALHYDPATLGQTNALLVVLATGLFGLVAGDVTMRTGTLWPAIILHFANNAVAMMTIALDGTITGLALYVTAVDVTDEATVRDFLLRDILSFGALYLVWCAMATRLQIGAPLPMSATSTGAQP
ncbi:MAG: type II CAAX endopeptidase family protein [Pseudomonadota bacterium]